MTPPSFCANCIEEKSLRRAVRNGKSVYLCDSCRDPCEALGIYADKLGRNVDVARTYGSPGGYGLYGAMRKGIK